MLAPVHTAPDPEHRQPDLEADACRCPQCLGFARDLRLAYPDTPGLTLEINDAIKRAGHVNAITEAYAAAVAASRAE